MEVSSATCPRIDLLPEDKVEGVSVVKEKPVPSDFLQASQSASWSFSYVKIMVVAAVAIGIFALAAFAAKYIFRQEDRAQAFEARMQYYKEQMRQPCSS